MIGGVVLFKDGSEEDHAKFFYRFGEMSVAERTVENVHNARALHRTVLAMPSADQSVVFGTPLKKSVVNINKTRKYGTPPSFEFHHDANDILARLYNISNQYGFSHVVVVRANCLFIPSWLIDAMLYRYMEKNVNCYYYSSGYSQGLEVEIIPYWLLSKAFSFCPGDKDYRQYMLENKAAAFENKDAFHIPVTNINLAFEGIEQVEAFENIIQELDVGTDLGDILAGMIEDE